MLPCVCSVIDHHVAVRLFSNRSHMTSKCGKNISDSLFCSYHMLTPKFKSRFRWKYSSALVCIRDYSDVR